jgi:hypothetical protein
MTPRARKRTGRPPKNGQPLHIRLANHLYRALKARAEADGRTLTATVERLLAAALEKGTP